MSMIEVSRDHFFQAVGGPENIHPTPRPEFSEWKNLNTHATVGRSEPGYLSSFFKPKRYWLEESFANRKPFTAKAGQQDLFAA